jgi:hypothetical protein
MRYEITNNQAIEIISSFNLSVGDTFSNNEPSDLCYEYRMETGYWLPNGESRLVLRVTTKDENDETKHITKNTLIINADSLGVDEDAEQISLKKYNEILNIVYRLSEITGLALEMPNSIENMLRINEFE